MNKPIITIVFAFALVISSTAACTTSPNPTAASAPTHLPTKPSEPAAAASPRPSELPELAAVDSPLPTPFLTESPKPTLTSSPSPTSLPTKSPEPTITIFPSPTSLPTELPKPTITRSPTPIPDSPCSLVDTWNWSPDGQFGAAVVYDGNRIDWPTIYAQDGHCTQFEPPNKWGSFLGWTSDSQYAVFIAYDQYANTHTAVFDTHAWAPVDLPDSLECITGMSAPYYTHPCHTVAIAPITPRILFAHGVILDLTTLFTITITEMISGTMPSDEYYIEEAAWSPNETQLAFFTLNGNVVCVSNGDGTQTRQVTSLPSHCSETYANLRWSDEQHLSVFLQGKPRSECYLNTDILTKPLP